MKSIRYFLLGFFIFTAPLVFSQTSGDFNHKKERKHVWRHWSRKKDGYNPYLKKKNKNKPSVQEAKASKREIRRQKRDYKKQLKRAKRN